jgi:hypothetical protein
MGKEDPIPKEDGIIADIRFSDPFRHLRENMAVQNTIPFLEFRPEANKASQVNDDMKPVFARGRGRNNRRFRRRPTANEQVSETTHGISGDSHDATCNGLF